MNEFALEYWSTSLTSEPLNEVQEGRKTRKKISQSSAITIVLFHVRLILHFPKKTKEIDKELALFCFFLLGHAFLPYRHHYERP